MRRLPIVVLVFLAALLGLGIAAAPVCADPVKPVPPKAVQVHTANAPLLTAPPMMSPAQIAQSELALQELARLRILRALAIPIGPGAPPAVRRAPTQVGAAELLGIPRAPGAAGDFTVFRNTILSDAFTNNSTSSTDEPSLGMNCETVFYSGNWYASVSADGGQNFTFVDPATTFPSFSGGFCCDQVVYFEQSRGLMFWYLQYAKDGNGNNTIVLAWTTSNAATQGGAWSYFSLSPQADFGYGNGVWFDFPEVSVSDNFVYFTTDVIGASENALALKLGLDDAADGGGVTLTGFFSDYAFLRPTHGAAGTMYIGAHKSTSEMRIYTWAEGDASPGSSDDRAVDAWLQGTYSAPSPDGTDWVNFGIPSLLAAWVADGKVGFMWDSVQGDGFPWPNVRFAVFNVGGLGLADQGQIWNDDYAFAYPSVHPNDAGNIAGTIALGGGDAPPGNPFPYPSFGAWISDDYNGDVIAPAELYVIAESDAGPSSNRWGDYLTSRRAVPYGNTWAATGFVLNGGQSGGFVDPYFVWFGREADTPQPTITCPGDVIVECADPCGTPANDAQLAAFFAGVSASDACPLTVTNDAPVCFGFGTTTVTFMAANDLGLSATCTADVTVVDTTPPQITSCPDDITVECSAFCGVPSDDPQLAAFFGAFAATDVCDSEPTLTNDSPSCFALGTTTVTFTATDDSGNASHCTADVTVIDTTPPVIDVVLNRDVLWPPNHKWSDITADVTVTDVCCENPTFTLVSITSDEPEDGKGDGHTAPDIEDAEYGSADVAFQLRSERLGNEDGRVYTITYRAEDCVGNTTDNVVYVRVPHDHAGWALASMGFQEGGLGFEPTLDRYVLIVRSMPIVLSTSLDGSETLLSPAFDATELDVTRMFVGNAKGVTLPVEVLLVDNDADGLTDLALYYSAPATNAILEASMPEKDGEIALDGSWGPIGLHYISPAGLDYLVPNIFELGEPVPLVPPIVIGRSGDPNDDTNGGDSAKSRTVIGLGDMYPNPFNPTTTIPFTLASQERVSLRVYDAQGSLVRTLEDESLPAGPHSVVWNGRDNNGRQVATGIYFVRLVTGSLDMTKKLVMIK